jgi:hypothetical protein
MMMANNQPETPEDIVVLCYDDRKCDLNTQREIQGGSNMTGTECGLFTHKSAPVIFESPCN